METRPSTVPPTAITPSELRDIGLFGALGDDALQYLASNLKILQRRANEIVFDEGDPAREFYVILQGEVEVFKVLERGAEARLATLTPGHWFGEMSVLDVQPRSASVRALV